MEHCTKDALEFLKEVRSRFIEDNKRDKFDDFVRLFMAYKKERFHIVPQIIFLYYIMR
jgi:hypothetical protein